MPGRTLRLTGFRAVLAVPLMREAGARGAIFLWRREPGLFSPDQVALVQTFARQAIIAIENARLFQEVRARNADLSEALEQQTATGEILRAIASSPTDIQPVLETVVRSAARFCAAPDVALLRVDGSVLRGAAAVGAFADVLRSGVGSIDALEIPATRASVTGRAVVDRRTVHVHDLAAESEREYPTGRELQRRFGHHTILATPLLREGMPLGVIALFRMEVNPFSDRQVELLRTFADQAVIAIENVRLFTELGDRNRDLTEALEQQTATSEILRVISQSQTDVQPVFDTIVAAASKLCGAASANVFTFDGELIQLAAFVNVNPEYVRALRSYYPKPPGRDTAVTRAIQTCAVAAIPDVDEDRDYSVELKSLGGGFRSILAVPLVREGRPIGGIAIGRLDPGPFSDSQVALLQTFADQAIIAIENVRLFTELGDRNRDLTEALEQQTATSEILRAISSSPTDVQPVFDIIGESAERLCNAEISVVSRVDGDLIRMVAVHGVTAEGREAIRRFFPDAVGRRNSDRALDPQAGRGACRRRARGSRLRRQGRGAGGPIPRLSRACRCSARARSSARSSSRVTSRGIFTDAQVQLLKTFADQAVIADRERAPVHRTR